MSWLLAVLIGHLLNAVSFVLDKVLLTKSIQNAYAFTFFIGLLGLAALGVAALVPLTVGGIVNKVNGPQTRRGAQRRLDGIRRSVGAGFVDDELREAGVV